MKPIAMGDTLEIEDHVRHGESAAQVEMLPFRKRWKRDRKSNSRRALRTIEAELKAE